MKRIKLDINQFRRVLERPDTKVKYPIIIDFAKVTKKEAQEIIDLLKQKRA